MELENRNQSSLLYGLVSEQHFFGNVKCAQYDKIINLINEIWSHMHSQT